MCFVPVSLFVICAASVAGQAPGVDQIMTRVAENQARTQEMRRTFTYHQKIDARLHRANGKIAREEKLEYLVTPKANGVEKKLTHFEGKYESKGRLISYDQPGQKHKNADWDGDFIGSMVKDLTADKESKDGIGRDLFPLTGQEQEKYLFKPEGEDTYRGRKVYRITFRPKPDHPEAPWKGETLIDAEEGQPLFVSTRLATAIPTAVKVLPGTDIKGLGFAVSYGNSAMACGSQ